MDRADDATEDAAAETPESSSREPFHARRADALAGIAESYLNGEPGKPGDNATADRYQVVLHVTAETLDSVQMASREEADGELQFRDPRERRLNRYVVPTPVPDDAAVEDWMVSHRQDLAIDADTCVPNWLAGDRMDWDLAVGNLFLA